MKQTPEEKLQSIKVGHEMRKQIDDICDLVFEKYLQVAINNDMERTNFSNYSYKYTKEDENQNLINELGLWFAFERISIYSKHCSLIRYDSCGDNNYGKFELIASNSSIRMAHIGECYIYGLK